MRGFILPLLATGVSTAPSAPTSPSAHTTKLLQQAALAGDADTITQLLSKGVDPDAVGHNGHTSLIIAANNGHVAVADNLLDHGADVNVHGKGDISALHAAAGQGHDEMVNTLCVRGASLDAVTAAQGYTPCAFAARAGHTAVIRRLVQHGARLDVCGRDGYTPLHLAASHDQTEAAAALIDAGASLAQCGKEGFSPLHVAAFSGSGGVAELLIERGADVEAQSKEGNTPLHVAVYRGHAHLVAICLAHGASCTAQSVFGETALHQAAAAGSVALTQLLLAHGASPTLADQNGDTPLHTAADTSAEVLSVLLAAVEGDAPLHVANTELWRSVLLTAAWRGDEAAMQMLLPPSALAANDHRGDLTAELEDALAEARRVATESGRADVLRLLGAKDGKGAEVTASDAAGRHGAMSDATISAASRDATGVVVDQGSADGAASAAWQARLGSLPPLSHALLGCNASPTAVHAQEVLVEMCAGAQYSRYLAARAAVAGGAAGTVLRVPGALDRAACAVLRRALDARGVSGLDSVDGMQEHVLYLSGDELAATIGGAAFERLLSLPLQFREAAAAASAGDGGGRSGGGTASYRLFDCFLRRYSAEEEDQLLTSFHQDRAALTVNLALTPSTSHAGGKLLGVYGGHVHAIGRGEGEATVHSSSLLHGVTRMREGTRYSLIAFFVEE